MRCTVGSVVGNVAFAFALAVILQSATRAAAWSDDFNDGSIADGNPVMWLTDLGGTGFFPGAYDASSGDLRLDPSDDSPTGQMSALVPAESFTDTYVRAQGKVLPDPNNPNNNGGNLVLTARIDPGSLSGYLVYFDVAGGLNLQILLGGDTTDLTTTYQSPFNASSEVVVELNVVGSQLSAYVWEANDPAGKPAAPQVTATDTTLASGVAGVAYSEDDPFTSCIYRYVAAQGAPFVDGVAGDYNNNGVVDAADYVVYRHGGPLAHEVDNIGTIDAGDYAAWRARFANTTGSGAGGLGPAAVPEPSIGAVLLLSIVAIRSIGPRRPR